ncbi:MAG TPA: hypothetical protein ENJ95_20735 [Bacteroidetes bacterium]|nr:hypothetical protein [Bacteroidota bacterium]
MKKNKLFVLFLFISFTTFVHAQQPAHTHISIDSRLYQAFDSGYLENLITENPFLLNRWNFYLDNSWYVADLPPEKDNGTLPVIQIDDLDNINIFLLEKEQHLKKDWDRARTYRIKNTDLVLVCEPGKNFTEKLNKHLNR